MNGSEPDTRDLNFYFLLGLCVCKQSELGNIQCESVCSQSFVPFSKTYLLVGTVYFFLSIFFMVMFYGTLFRVVKQKSFGQRRGAAQEYKIKVKKYQSRKKDENKTFLALYSVGIVNDVKH